MDKAFEAKIDAKIEQFKAELRKQYYRSDYATWDETKHPRQSSGSDKGGEFAPKGDGSAPATGSDWHANTAQVKDGKKVMPTALAQQGHDLAMEWQRSDNEWSEASAKLGRLQNSKLKRDQKLIPEAAAAEKSTLVRFRAARAAADTFEKKHGASVLDAYEAHTGRGWPFYRVESAAGSSRAPKFTT